MSLRWELVRAPEWRTGSRSVGTRSKRSSSTCTRARLGCSGKGTRSRSRSRASAGWRTTSCRRRTPARPKPATCDDAALLGRVEFVEPLASLLGDAQVGIFRYVDIVLEESEFLLLVDVDLHRLQVGQGIGVAVVVLVGENPVFEELRRLLGELRDDFHGFLVIFWIKVEPAGAQDVLHEIDHRCAILLQKARACRPQQGLC